MLDVHDGDIKDDPGILGKNGNKNGKRNAIRDRKALWFTRDVPYTWGKHQEKYIYQLHEYANFNKNVGLKQMSNCSLENLKILVFSIFC